jgi:hypothetical protein
MKIITLVLATCPKVMRMASFGAALAVAAGVGYVSVLPAPAQVPDYQQQTQDQINNACVLADCRNRSSPGAARVVVQWAALAVSPSTLKVGASHGQNSESDAKQRALSNCAAAAPDCELMNWGHNVCFALATSRAEGARAQAFNADRARAAEQALALCRSETGKNCQVQVAPCANDDPRWSSPLPLPRPAPGAASKVDARIVGTWEYAVNPGRWVWEIGPGGTYEFHSQAMDGAASHAGSLSTSDEHWTLRASNGYQDGGTYRFESPDTLIATGRLGTGTWRRTAK